jgi:hypothetical protein
MPTPVLAQGLYVQRTMTGDRMATPRSIIDRPSPTASAGRVMLLVLLLFITRAAQKMIMSLMLSSASASRRGGSTDRERG